MTTYWLARLQALSDPRRVCLTVCLSVCLSICMCVCLCLCAYLIC